MSAPVASGPEPGSGSRWRMTPMRWLLVAIAGYFAVSFAMSWLRAIEFQTTTWDQGLYQQALWMTAHGRPFYETADVETGGYGSLLDVHSVFLLYLLVPVYAVLPYETTLFAVQSTAVALAALPLFLLARDVSHSSRLGLIAGVVYLCWTPTLSSNLYDFHAEAFLPIEIFTVVLLWNRQRYLAGFAAAIAAFLTFEFAPVVVLAVAVFALVPGALASSRGEVLPGRTASGWGTALRAWVRIPRVRASLVLGAASVAAYAILLIVRVDYLPGALGTYPLPAASSGYVIGATPASLGLAPGNILVGFGTKATYWLLLLGLLAFVPLLAPRSLILSLPWFAFTLFSTNLNYVTLGFQYGLVAGSTLMVGFAFGIPRAQRAVESWLVPSPSPASAQAGPERPRPRARPARFGILVGIVALLAVNVALTPVNPAMQNAGLGSAYRVSYEPSPGDRSVVQLAGLVPAGATVLTTDNLFPLVANDPNAYSFLWATDPVLSLPFNLDHPPTYVLIAEDRTAAVISWLTGVLYDPSLYGVRGVAWSSSAGTVLLFEAGYSGPTASFGADPPGTGTYYGLPLASQSDGVPTTTNGSTFPTVLESVPGETGTVWYGPSATLPPGNYTVTVSLRVQTIEGFPPPSANVSVLWVGALAFAQPAFYGWSFPFGELDAGMFTTVSFSVSLSEPTMEFDVEGVLLDSSVQVTLNYLEIAFG